MDLGKLFKDFHLEKVKLNLKAVEFEISFQEADRDAAWDLYVEMLTRIVTQPLPPDAGDELAALESVHSLAPTTRDILRHHGRASIQFSKVAVPVLNQIIRPFTARWHRESLSGSFEQESKRLQFRKELESPAGRAAQLQPNARGYRRCGGPHGPGRSGRRIAMSQAPRHRTFVSYHHENDQEYKDRLVEEMAADIVDRSVEDGDIDDGLDTEAIWATIRDEHLSDATVLLVLIGPDTWSRKFVDWEIGSALNKSRNNARCGVLGIVLPDHPDYGERQLDPNLLPQRLAANIGGEDPYVRVYHWPDDGSLSVIRDCVHAAFIRRDGPPPDNYSKRFKYNRDASTRVFRWDDVS